MAKRSGRKSGQIKTPEREAAQRYGALLRALPDLVFVIDHDGTYVDYWADHESDLAFPADKILGSNIRDVGFEPEDLRRVTLAMNRSLKTGRLQTVEYVLNTLQGYGHFEARIVPLSDSRILTIVRNISERVEQNQRLVSTSARLASERTALLHKNAALEEVLKHLDTERKTFRAEVLVEVARAVHPIVARLKDSTNRIQVREAEHLEAELQAILSSEEDSFLERFSTLTPRELELCRLLQNGKSSKQISDQLNVSLSTVHKHREHIRRKLGFQGQQVNLTSYLRLHSPKSYS